MVTLALMQQPSVQKWLGGIEPAWLSLDRASARALERPPSPSAGPIRLASDLTPAEVQQSAVARNALVLLNAAAAARGLKLTATGKLSRTVVAQMSDLFTWPDFDRVTAFALNKVVNEQDFLPLYFVRHVAHAAKLFRRYKGRLVLTPTGRRLSADVAQGPLQAILFHVAFWFFDLGYFAYGPYDGWPQRDAGIVLWCLSVAANDWQTPGRLTRLCTIPIEGVMESQYDMETHAMEARILRPLHWFGLLEFRREGTPGPRSVERRFFRKTPLFDRFLSFDVRLENIGSARH